MALNLSFSFTLPGFGQTAQFGADTPAGTGGWKPSGAGGALVDIASYDSLVAGSLGGHTPTIADGRLTFSGGGAGAPDGAVLRVGIAGGGTIDVTIAEVPDRIDWATDADRAAAGQGIAGKTYSIRRNAGLGPWSFGQFFSVVSHIDNPVTIEGEGPHVEGEDHLHNVNVNRVQGLTLRNLIFPRNDETAILIAAGDASIRCRGIVIEGCTLPGPVVDTADGATRTVLQASGYSGLGNSPQTKILTDTSGAPIDGLLIRGNVIHDIYTGISVAAAHFQAFVANSIRDFYFDAAKVTPARHMILEANHVTHPLGEGAASANGFADDPHSNIGWQITHANDNPTVSEYVHMLGECYDDGDGNAVPDPGMFFHWGGSNTAAAATAGGKLFARGCLIVSDGYSPIYMQAAEDCDLAHIMLLPRTRDSYPFFAPSNEYSINLADGTLNVGKEASIGAHRVANSFVRTTTSTGPITETNVAKFDGQSLAYFTARLPNWANQATRPELLDSWGQAEVTGDLVGKSPLDVFTPGTNTNLAGYAVSLPAPAIALSAVSGGSGSVAATVTSDQTGDTHLVHWALSTNQSLSAEDVALTRRCVTYGVTETSGGVGTVSAVGIAAGTYWLHAVQFVGMKSVGQAGAVQVTVT